MGWFPVSGDAWAVLIAVVVLAAVWVVPKFVAAARVIAGADDLFDVHVDDEFDGPAGGAR